MNRSTDAASLEGLIDAYCAAWNEPDAARREEILRDVWAADATYTDPKTQVAGLKELVAHIGAVLARRPGARVIRTSRVDAHHRLARFAWRVVQADGTMLPESIDFAEIADDAKLQRIIGFFGPLAAAS
jgi:SnoaL-like domain